LIYNSQIGPPSTIIGQVDYVITEVSDISRYKVLGASRHVSTKEGNDFEKNSKKNL